MRALFAVLALTAWLSGPSAVRAEDWAPAGVKYQPRGYGWILTNAQGMTLYTFARDQTGEVPKCTARCIDLWPPLMAAADAQAQGEWTLVARKDGARQWAFRGKPLYSYANDAAPGDINGDTINHQWFIAIRYLDTPAGITVRQTGVGYILTGSKGLTLYTSDRDKPNVSACDARCARTWHPLEVPWAATAHEVDWSIVARADGTKQWAFRKKPVYTYDNDVDPGDMAGNGLETSWHAIVLEPPPPFPDWVTFQESDNNSEFASNQQGLTLYAHDPNNDPTRPPSRAKNAIERPDQWLPVLAAPGAKPVGQWSLVAPVVDHEPGALQWAWRGLRVYTNKLDKLPGDIYGYSDLDRLFFPITRTPGTGT